jgi:lipopolysaccharide/colanic/teichoic acid biosynthesis glycosyltransferase
VTVCGCRHIFAQARRLAVDLVGARPVAVGDGAAWHNHHAANVYRDRRPGLIGLACVSLCSMLIGFFL